jgi:hypothetical protein
MEFSYFRTYSYPRVMCLSIVLGGSIGVGCSVVYLHKREWRGGRSR